MNKELKVLHREEYQELKRIVEGLKNFKVGNYTYETAPSSFHHWASWQTGKSQNLIRYLYWYKKNKELQNSIDGGD